MLDGSIPKAGRPSTASNDVAFLSALTKWQPAILSTIGCSIPVSFNISRDACSCTASEPRSSSFELRVVPRVRSAVRREGTRHAWEAFAVDEEACSLMCEPYDSSPTLLGRHA